MTIQNRVTAILVEQLGVHEDAVTRNATIIGDLGADSLDVIEVVMAVEDEFNIVIPDEDAEKIETVQGIIDYLTERTKAKA